VIENPDGAGWKITSPDVPDADPTKLQQAAGGFTSLRAANVVDGPPPKDSGLDKPSGSVTIRKKDGTAVTITIGALKDKVYYARVTGRSEVFTVQEFMGNRLLRAPGDFKKADKPPGAGGAHGMPGMPPGM
jgi:hypothetical protein